MELSSTGKKSLPPSKMHTRRKPPHLTRSIFASKETKGPEFHSLSSGRCSPALSGKNKKLPATLVASRKRAVIPGWGSVN